MNNSQEKMKKQTICEDFEINGRVEIMRQSVPNVRSMLLAEMTKNWKGGLDICMGLYN